MGAIGVFAGKEFTKHKTRNSVLYLILSVYFFFLLLASINKGPDHSEPSLRVRKSICACIAFLNSASGT